MRRANRFGFALYEVLLGLAVFAIGVVALGRAVGNCIRASSLRADDDRVRDILSNRMAEVQAAPSSPEEKKETKIDTGFGTVALVQKVAAQEIKENGVIIPGIRRVTLTANWRRDGIPQTKQLAFYVYRLR